MVRGSLYPECGRCNSVMYKTHESWSTVDKKTGTAYKVKHYKCSNRKCNATIQERGEEQKVR